MASSQLAERLAAILYSPEAVTILAETIDKAMGDTKLVQHVLGHLGQARLQGIVDDAEEAFLRSQIIERIAQGFGEDAATLLDRLYDPKSEAILFYKGHLISSMPSADDPATYLSAIYRLDVEKGKLVFVDSPAWTDSSCLAKAIEKCILDDPGDELDPIDLDEITVFEWQTADYEDDLAALCEEVGLSEEEMYQRCHAAAIRSHGVVSSIAEAIALLGYEAAKEVLGRACAKAGIHNKIIEFYWDYTDESPFTYKLIGKWLDEQTRQRGYTYPYLAFPEVEQNKELGFAGATKDLLLTSLMNKVYDELHEAYIDWEIDRYNELRNSFEDEVSKALSELSGEHIEVEIDVDPDFYEFCDDYGIEVDYDLDRWLSEEVCLDIVLAEGEERNTMFNTNRNLRYALENPDVDVDIDEDMQSSALLWLAERQGVSREDVLSPTPSEKALPFRNALTEEYAGDEVTICVHATLEEYVELIAEYADGGEFEVRGKPSTVLFDSINGGGARLDESSPLVKDGLIIPSALVAEIAIDGNFDPYNRGKGLKNSIGMQKGGYTVHTVYGVSDEPWKHGKIVPFRGFRHVKTAFMSIADAKAAQKLRRKPDDNDTPPPAPRMSW